MKTYKATTK